LDLETKIKNKRGLLKSIAMLTAMTAEILRKDRRDHNISPLIFAYFAKNFANFAVK
jgi:hypothetical protein